MRKTLSSAAPAMERRAARKVVRDRFIALQRDTLSRGAPRCNGPSHFRKTQPQRPARCCTRAAASARPAGRRPGSCTLARLGRTGRRRSRRRTAACGAWWDRASPAQARCARGGEGRPGAYQSAIGSPPPPPSSRTSRRSRRDGPRGCYQSVVLREAQRCRRRRGPLSRKARPGGWRGRTRGARSWRRNNQSALLNAEQLGYALTVSLPAFCERCPLHSHLRRSEVCKSRTPMYTMESESTTSWALTLLML
jgi:hypothetical protein